MAYIPRAVCVIHDRGMTIRATGACIEMMDSNDQPYYKIYGDIWECAGHPCQVFLPADRPVAEHFERNYDSFPVTRRATFG